MQAFPRQSSNIPSPTQRTLALRSFVVSGKTRDLLRFCPSLKDKSKTEKAVLSSKLFDEMALENRHTWIRKSENVFSWNELVPFLYASRAVTGLCVSLKDISESAVIPDKELKLFLKRLNRHVNALEEALPFKKEGVAMGYILEVMVPEEMDDLDELKDIAELTMRLLGFDNNATFFVRHYHKGKNGNYLGIFVTPRIAFKKPEEIVVSRANKPRYRSAKTGKMCKKSCRDAVLVCKEGDVLKTMKAWFSETTGFLDLSVRRFREVMTIAKASLNEIYDFLGFKECKRVVLGEYDGNDKSWSDYNKDVIKRYNLMFQKVEEEINKLYQSVLSMNESVKMWFRDLVVGLRRMQRNVVTRKDELSRPSDILVRFDAPYVVTKKAIDFMYTKMMQKVVVFENSLAVALDHAV